MFTSSISRQRREIEAKIKKSFENQAILFPAQYEHRYTVNADSCWDNAKIKIGLDPNSMPPEDYFALVKGIAQIELHSAHYKTLALTNLEISSKDYVSDLAFYNFLERNMAQSRTRQASIIETQKNLTKLNKQLSALRDKHGQPINGLKLLADAFSSGWNTPSENSSLINNLQWLEKFSNLFENGRIFEQNRLLISNIHAETLSLQNDVEKYIELLKINDGGMQILFLRNQNSPGLAYPNFAVLEDTDIDFHFPEDMENTTTNRIKWYMDTIFTAPKYDRLLLPENNFVQNVLNALQRVAALINVRPFFEYRVRMTRVQAATFAAATLKNEVDEQYRKAIRLIRERRRLPKIVKFMQHCEAYKKKFPFNSPPVHHHAINAFVPVTALKFLEQAQVNDGIAVRVDQEGQMEENSGDVLDQEVIDQLVYRREYYSAYDIQKTITQLSDELLDMALDNFQNLNWKGESALDYYYLICKAFERNLNAVVVNRFNKKSTRQKNICFYLKRWDKHEMCSNLVYMVAISSLTLGQWRNAIKLFNEIKSDRSRDPMLFLGLANANRGINNSDLQIKNLIECKSLLSKDSEHYKPVILRLVDLYKSKDDCKRGFDLIEEYVDLYGADNTILEAFWYLNKQSRIGRKSNSDHYLDALLLESEKEIEQYINETQSNLSESMSTFFYFPNPNIDYSKIIDKPKIHKPHNGYGITRLLRLSTDIYATSSFDKTIKIWNKEFNYCYHTLVGHTGYVWSIVLLEGGKMASGSGDKTIKIWDIDSGECLDTLIGHTKLVNLLAVHPSGRLISGSFDGTVCIWKKSLNGIEKIIKHGSAVNGLDIFPNGDLVVGSHDKLIKIYDFKSGKNKCVLRGHENSIHSVCVLSNRLIASGSKDCTIRIWDVTSKTCVNILKGHKSLIEYILPLSQNKIISSSYDKCAKIWDLSTNKCISTLAGHTHFLEGITILENNQIATVSQDGTIRLWKFAKSKIEYTFDESLNGNDYCNYRK